MSGKKLAFAFLLFLVPLALGFSSAEGTHGSALTDILGKTVNFIILFGGLGFLLAKPLRRFLEEAGLAVEKTIEKTQSAKKNAEQKLEALKERMAGLEAEARKIREDGREAGKNESDRLLSQARDETDKIKSQTGLEIKMHAQGARTELRKYAAELAVTLAETNIKPRDWPAPSGTTLNSAPSFVSWLNSRSGSPATRL
jgi:F0F1-type ATP synthase membrane subunit b/b'